MSDINPKLLADLADDNDPNGLGDGLDAEDGVAAPPSPKLTDGGGGAAADITLPPAETSDLYGLPLPELLDQLDAAARRRRSRRRGADFTLPPAQRLARISKIANKLDAAQLKLAALEAHRGDVDVLDDAELTSYHSDLAGAQALVTTLQAALGRHIEAHDQAEAIEARETYEQRARSAIAENARAYADKLQQLHFHTAQVAALGGELDDHKQAIEGISFDAVSRDRAYLAFNPEIIRRAVCREFEGGSLNTPVLPERCGETDGQWLDRLLTTLAARANGRADGGESDSKLNKQAIERARQLYVQPMDGEDNAAYAARQLAHLSERLPCRRAETETEDEHVARVVELLARKLHLARKGESDSAYELRVANAYAMAADKNAGDVLDLAGQRAVPVIENHCASPTTAERTRRLHQHGRHVRVLAPWAVGGKPMADGSYAVAGSPPLPEYVREGIDALSPAQRLAMLNSRE